jgi:hypothetical protein
LGIKGVWSAIKLFLSCEGVIHPNADLKRTAFENGWPFTACRRRKKGAFARFLGFAVKPGRDPRVF